jgi:hypothetical protein
MRRKKILYKTILIIVFISVVSIPFIDWNKKDKIHDKFRELEFKVYQNIPRTSSDTSLSIFTFCDTVEKFIEDYPIDLDIELICEDYSQLDTFDIKSMRSDFIDKVQKIDNAYRNQENRANWIMFAVLIISQILVAIIRRQIDKRFKVKKDLETK